jgi:hypothetical protein
MKIIIIGRNSGFLQASTVNFIILGIWCSRVKTLKFIIRRFEYPSVISLVNDKIAICPFFSNLYYAPFFFYSVVSYLKLYTVFFSY